VCGRFTLTANIGTLALRFDAQPPTPEILQRPPRFNIAPTQPVLCVTALGLRHFAVMQWGLVPSWAKDPQIGSRMINARAETLAEKPSFKRLLSRKRCLVLADGYYEWLKPTQKIGRRALEQPVRIVLKSGEPFAFAGLWDEWETYDNQILRTCTIITTAANELLQKIHDRMPVILEKSGETMWLDTSIADFSRLQPLLKPFPAAQMDFYFVSPAVNSPQNDTPDVIKPLKTA
jgi:putative SOS response-associated peptidase YedK